MKFEISQYMERIHHVTSHAPISNYRVVRERRVVTNENVHERGVQSGKNAHKLVYSQKAFGVDRLYVEL